MGFPWTDEAIDQLRKLRSDGLSCAEVGRVLGTSRNAVIGKCHRLGIDTPAHAPPRYKPASRAPRKPKPPNNFMLVNIARKAVARVSDPVLIVEQPKPPEYLGIALLDLKSGQCRYSPNAEPPYLFCGQPVVAGKSWCEHCCRLVFGKPYKISEEDRARRREWGTILGLRNVSAFRGGAAA